MQLIFCDFLLVEETLLYRIAKLFSYTSSNLECELIRFCFCLIHKPQQNQPAIKNIINEMIARRALPVICLIKPNVTGPQIDENLLKTE